jgi:uncharacterized protein (TIGR02285 family)
MSMAQGSIEPLLCGCNMNRVFFIASFLLLANAMPVLAEPGDLITVAWRDKAPYHYREKGIEKGFLLERAKQVFAIAGIPAQFIEEPAKRIWQNFSNKTKSYCSIGWYRLPEREIFANFSGALHIDRPQTILVAPAAAAKIKTHLTLASLLADKELTLGAVGGVSYGPALDTMIAHSANRLEQKIVSPVNMMRMTSANRISFMFADRDDIDFLKGTDVGLKNTLPRDFPDMPPGLTRYILCSKDVPPGIMSKLNKALDTIKNKSSPPQELAQAQTSPQR